MSKSHRQLQNTKIVYALTSYPQQNSKSKSKFAKQINITQLITKAKNLYNSGDLKPALFLFQQAMNQFTSSSYKERTLQIEVYYLAATICMAVYQYIKAEKYLKKVVKETGNYKNSTLLLLSICLNKIGKVQESLVYLDELCDKLKSMDGLFYRGKLRLKNMQYSQAAEDFSEIINKISPNNSQAKLYLIESQFLGGKFHKNMEQKLYQLEQQLSQMKPKQNENIKKCRNLLAQICLQQGKLSEAQKLLNKNFEQFKRDSQSLLIKSKICAMEGKTDQQVLLLNQSITVKDHKRSVTQALEILVIQAMKQKDFYEAFQYSKRTNYIKIENKATLNLFKIAQAVTFLMKKKYGQGLLILGAIKPQIFKLLGPNQRFITNLLYNSLGYAHFNLGQHTEALEMYKKIEINMNEADWMAYSYNIKLCEGIIISKSDGNFEEAIKLFQTSTNYLMRAEPYFYISVILIQRNLAVNNAEPDLFSRVLAIIDSGLKAGDNYQMYYYRSLLYMYLGMNAQALEDVDKAIQKSEDNVAAFFYIRALLFFQQKNYECATAQLTTCLSIDDKYFEAYLLRAKIKIINQQSEEAYEDLANYPLNQQWRPLFLLYELQFGTIVKQNIQFGHATQIAHFHLGHFENGGSAGKVILAIMGQNYQQVISLLNDAIEINYQIGCLDFDDVYLLKAYCCCQVGLFEQALNMLNKSEEVLKSNEFNPSFGEEDEKKLLAIKMNAIFVHIKSKQLEKSLQLCNNLISQVYQGVVYDELLKLQNHLSKVLTRQTLQTHIQLFRTTPMMSDYFPQQNIYGIDFRFFIPFPRVRVPEIQNASYEQPLIDFTVKDIENKAQAPWMRKDQNGVIFTNKIQIFQNLNLYTEVEEHSVEVNNKTSKQKLKQQLLKDAEMLNKLDKLNKIGKPSKSSSSVA